MKPNNIFESDQGYRGRTALVINRVLAGAERHRGRPLNSIAGIGRRELKIK